MSYTFVFKHKDECVYLGYNKSLDSSHGGKPKHYPYSEIKTILTEEEYNALMNNKVNKDEIIQKLQSEEAKKFHKRIIEEEMEFCCKEYGITKDEVKDLFEYSSSMYTDRNCIACVYEDADELASDCLSMVDYGYGEIDIDHPLFSYIDFSGFLEEWCYYDETLYQLGNGKIARVYI